jgi:serine/threonine protein kinase
MINTFLPLLHAFILLDRVASTSLTGADAHSECEFVEESLSRVLQRFHDLTIVQLLCEVKTAVVEKRRAAFAVHEAHQILRSTRVSGNASVVTVSSVSIADFTFLKAISAGAFARVFLAQKTKTGDVYAIKVLPKSDVVQKNQVKRVLAEKDILLGFSSPYIINFYYSIIGTHNLYLVMEYLPGGDLYSLLQKLGALDEWSAKTYIYQIANALAYLHSMGIIHRDLKPDNVLITENGHLKLTDFGLSYNGLLGRHVAKDTDIVESSSLVGTPDYIAPEIVLRCSHSFGVDWWALGIMVFEFVFGEPPFHAESETEIYTRIVRGRYSIPDDTEVSSQCLDLISRLLETDPGKRLGVNGSQEVLKHEWFADIDPRAIEPPFVPELKGRDDTDYFESRYVFSSAKDADIEDDIAIGRRGGRVERTDSGMQAFPSVAVRQLQGANQEAFTKLKMAGKNRGSQSDVKIAKLQVRKPVTGTDDSLLVQCWAPAATDP